MADLKDFAEQLVVEKAEMLVKKNQNLM